MASRAVHIKDYTTEIPGALDGDVWRFPPVETVNVRGKSQFWKISVHIVINGAKSPILPEYFNSKPIAGAQAIITVEAGQEGGKVRDAVPTVVSAGKNLGRSSQTNVWTQALRDALGLYNKQVKKSSGAAPGGCNITLYPPMLAQPLKDQKHPPPFPVFVQRKYNGVRTVAALDDCDGASQVVMYSRRRNLYPGLEYLKQELLQIMQSGVYLDGELYSHGVNLQDISGDARREGSEVKHDYLIYDCFLPAQPALTFSQRQEILQGLFDGKNAIYAKLAETFRADTMEEAEALYKGFLAEKYEGAMLRTDTPYVYSYNERHVKSLLKMKPTEDAEFEIVGWETGRKGKAAAAVMIICRTKSGIEFPVTPAATLEAREALARKMGETEPNGHTHFENHWKGRPLIVYFDEMSKDGVPQRARTSLEIRTWD